MVASMRWASADSEGGFIGAFPEEVWAGGCDLEYIAWRFVLDFGTPPVGDLICVPMPTGEAPDWTVAHCSQHALGVSCF